MVNTQRTVPYGGGRIWPERATIFRNGRSKALKKGEGGGRENNGRHDPLYK